MRSRPNDARVNLRSAAKRAAIMRRASLGGYMMLAPVLKVDLASRSEVGFFLPQRLLARRAINRFRFHPALLSSRGLGQWNDACHPAEDFLFLIRQQAQEATL